MTNGSSGWGFGTTSRSGGKPVEIKKPKLYDYTNGSRPRIPEEEQTQPVASSPKANSALPLPQFFDFNKK